jgi:hypothetical protein
MAKIKIEDAAAQVTAKLQANGGEMTHNALVQALEAAGNVQEAGMLMKLKQQGYLKFRVDYDQEAQVSTLKVHLPS